MPLWEKKQLDEYAVTLVDGQELWVEFILAPNLEEAAWSAFELSKDHNAQLKDVIRTDDW